VVTVKSAEDVYGCLVDFVNHADWRFDVLSCVLVSGDAGEVARRALEPTMGPQLRKVAAKCERALSEKLNS
jgi:hypothetical protein